MTLSLSKRQLTERIHSAREQNQRDLANILSARDQMQREMDESRIASRFNISVKGQFECPVCFDPCLPFAVLHPCGHHFCEQCCKRLQQRQCPLCRENYRNYTVVPMVTKLVEEACTYQCKGHQWGCEFVGTVDDAKAHALQVPTAAMQQVLASSLQPSPLSSSQLHARGRAEGGGAGEGGGGGEGIITCAFQCDENAREAEKWAGMAKIRLRPDSPWTLELSRPSGASSSGTSGGGSSPGGVALGIASCSHRRVKVDAHGGAEAGGSAISVHAALLVPNAALKFLLQKPNSSRRACDRTTPHNPSQCNLVHFRGDILVDVAVGEESSAVVELARPPFVLFHHRTQLPPPPPPPPPAAATAAPTPASSSATGGPGRMSMWIPSQLLQPSEVLNAALARPSQLHRVCELRHARASPATVSPHVDPWRRQTPPTSPLAAQTAAACPHLHFDDRKVTAWSSSCPSSPFGANTSPTTMLMRGGTSDPSQGRLHAGNLFAETTRSMFEDDDDEDFGDEGDEVYDHDGYDYDDYDDDAMMAYGY